MNSRIALVLKAKNISPAQLADELGVQRSGISHILNGRNKPSLDFIQKLLKRYPDISMSWLMFGDGPMMNPYPLKDTLVKDWIVGGQPSLLDLFEVPDQEDDKDQTPEGTNTIIMGGLNIENEEIKHDIEQLTEKAQKNNNLITAIESDNNEVKQNHNPAEKNPTKPEITRIVIFYSDRTFIEYSPGESKG